MSKVKVKMLTGIAGLANPAYDLPEHSYAPEEIVMLHPKLASAWIDGGIAKAIEEDEAEVPASEIDATSEVAAKSSPKPGRSKK